jgi:hypothetical protein
MCDSICGFGVATDGQRCSELGVLLLPVRVLGGATLH